MFHAKTNPLNVDQKLHLSSLVKLWAHHSEFLLHDLLTTQACLRFTPLELSLHALAFLVADLMFEECQSSFGLYMVERCGKSLCQKLNADCNRFVTFLNQATGENNLEATKESIRTFFITEIKPT